MSFHTSLLAAWPADLVTVATMLVAAAQVYPGRTKRQVHDPRGEVRIEHAGTERSGTATQPTRRHAYLLHVYGGPSNRGSDGAGAVQLAAVKAAVDEIVAAYDLSARLKGSLASLICVEAEEQDVDADPEEARFSEGRVRVVFTEGV